MSEDNPRADRAIGFGIPNGGWVPKGRKTEAARSVHRAAGGDLYPERTETKEVDSAAS